MQQSHILYKSLSHSAEVVKSLEHTLSVATLSAEESIRIERMFSDWQKQAENMESLLTELLEQYKAEESSAKQQIWERKLLDISLRNNLLNMKIGKNAIKVSADSTPSSLPTDIALLEDYLDMGKEFILDNKDLKGIYRAVRTNLEESGANTLFLTLGTLKWNERPGGKEYLAPLLLMPVEIVTMKKGQYAIRKRDEDVILNITLMEFLKQNYGIIVDGVNPLPQDAHGIDVSFVLHLVREAVAEHEGWEVIEDSVLGIFSFTKFVMWNDIHTHASAMAASPIVRSLIEGRLMLNDDVEPVDARKLDVMAHPNEFAIPVDADSSQLEAVVEAEHGRSFVLFGPPGTGKSQTITNLIANALYHDKRVLFVAQKKAALDVVENRLNKIGLSPFCLELHSNKMDKSHFLKQMEESITNKSVHENSVFKTTAEALFQQRQQLAGYVEALHHKQQSGYSLYDCIERYLSTDAEPMTLPKELCTGMTTELVENCCDRIKALDTAQSFLGGIAPTDHPLRGFIPKPQKKNDMPIFASKYMQGDTLESLLKALPQILSGIRQQIERGKTMSFMHKTTRQFIEGDFKLKKFLRQVTLDDALYDDIDAFTQAADRWLANIDKLPQWQKYADMQNELREQGLSAALNMFNGGRSTDQICQSFMKEVYRQVAQNIIMHSADLCDFNGISFGQMIDKYKALTSEFQQLTRQELLARLSARNPVGDKNPEISAELTLLRKRIGNKGRGTSIRSIIDQMPHLLPRLCPVMLMSPLSVAQYLDVEGVKFDIVVFDEASQMPTSEAIGAMARGKTVIIVGDPKQMPPTNFFSVNSVDDEDADIDDMESILDDCISLSMPTRYLGWHYRSKHESLIAFSNHNYYEGKLVTFPSTDDMVSHVNWQHVDGFYDFGKTRTNQAEAEAIVNEAVERMQTCPERSVGIITFSKQQSDLIEDILNERFASLPELDQQNMESPEPLFVKNLENVQGDERDVILFSVGYGPDKEGKVSMNFGPLNKVGGERRLNVAISRARYEMKIFSTLTPEQIDERRTNAEGVLGLKRFIKFAQHGSANNSSVSCSHSPESFNHSVMLRHVAKRLQQQGYEVKTDIGSSEFRVDLGVVNPAKPTEYLLGIVCDGEGYNHLKTMRDREIVRPTVLSMLGWNIMHVWSVDWFLNPDMVIKSILDTLKR